MSEIAWLRSYRFDGIALFDVAASYGVAFALAGFLGLSKRWTTLVVLAVLPLAVLAHIAFKQDTAFLKLLANRSFNWAKLVLAADLIAIVANK